MRTFNYCSGCPGYQQARICKKLSAENAACVGNGRNDQLMLKEAALGIAVISEEGAALATLNAADVVCTHIVSALELLTNPLRLMATLRI